MGKKGGQGTSEENEERERVEREKGKRGGRRRRRRRRMSLRVACSAFLFFSVGDRVIAGQLHNERETKSETGSKCLCRSDNGISGRLLRER